MTNELTTDRVAALLAEATPGPWITDEALHDRPYQVIRIGNEGNWRVCKVWQDDCAHDYNPEQVANAALIAAAPDLAKAYIAQAAQIEALEQAAQPRKRFPILGSGGAKVDWQLVADHGQQAKANHYQSVERLAERGGLCWVELHAVLFNRPLQKMDTNEAMIACRELEARYLAALIALRDKPAPAVTVREWHPIETAPKNALIDIWLAEGKRWCACYHDRITDEWRTSRPSGHLISIKARFVTHWMPLPEPPQSKFTPLGAIAGGKAIAANDQQLATNHKAQETKE